MSTCASGFTRAPTLKPLEPGASLFECRDIEGERAAGTREAERECRYLLLEKSKEDAKRLELGSKIR